MRASYSPHKRCTLVKLFVDERDGRGRDILEWILASRSALLLSELIWLSPDSTTPRGITLLREVMSSCSSTLQRATLEVNTNCLGQDEWNLNGKQSHLGVFTTTVSDLMV